MESGHHTCIFPNAYLIPQATGEFSLLLDMCTWANCTYSNYTYKGNTGNEPATITLLLYNVNPHSNALSDFCVPYYSCITSCCLQFWFIKGLLKSGWKFNELKVRFWSTQRGLTVCPQCKQATVQPRPSDLWLFKHFASVLAKGLTQSVCLDYQNIM